MPPRIITFGYFAATRQLGGVLVISPLVELVRGDRLSSRDVGAHLKRTTLLD